MGEETQNTLGLTGTPYLIGENMPSDTGNGDRASKKQAAIYIVVVLVILAAFIYWWEVLHLD